VSEDYPSSSYESSVDEFELEDVRDADDNNVT